MQIRNRKIFITGGAGFIGSTLIGRLIDHNEITVYDDLRRNSLKNKSYSKHPHLTIIKGFMLNG